MATFVPAPATVAPGRAGRFRFSRPRLDLTAAPRIQEGGWSGYGPTHPRRKPSSRTRPGPDERELQARWFSGAYGRRFTSVDEEPVEIVQFGHWNPGAGPDFSDAVVRVGKRELRGAIEMDGDVRDWEGHGHAANPAFEAVVLHVFFTSPDHGRVFTRTSRHRCVAQVQLDSELAGATRSVQGQVPEAHPGRCCPSLQTLDDAAVDRLVRAASRRRYLRRVRRWQSRAASFGIDQALFAGLAEGLGFHRNQGAMGTLAHRAPLRRLQELADPIETEALLLGTAGFLDKLCTSVGGDPEGALHEGRLLAAWQGLARSASTQTLPPLPTLVWDFLEVRPANHPQRRVATLARAARDWKSFRSALTQPLSQLIEPDRPFGWADWTDPYWSVRHRLGARIDSRGTNLIGGDRRAELLGNLILPARSSENFAPAWEAFLALPASGSSRAQRRVERRLFGADRVRARQWSRHFWQQQGLLEIYRDYCLRDASECDRCPFPEQLIPAAKPSY